MTISAPVDIAVTAAAFAVRVEHSVFDGMATYTRFFLPMFGMAIRTGGKPIVFAVVACQGLVNLFMAGGACLFWQVGFENRIPKRIVRVIMAAETDTSVPLCTF